MNHCLLFVTHHPHKHTIHTSPHTGGLFLSSSMSHMSSQKQQDGKGSLCHYLFTRMFEGIPLTLHALRPPTVAPTLLGEKKQLCTRCDMWLHTPSLNQNSEKNIVMHGQKTNKQEKRINRKWFLRSHGYKAEVCFSVRNPLELYFYVYGPSKIGLS